MNKQVAKITCYTSVAAILASRVVFYNTVGNVKAQKIANIIGVSALVALIGSATALVYYYNEEPA